MAWNDKLPAWEKAVNSKLEPYQGLVSILLIVIIIVSVWMLVSNDAVKRTAWTVYMYMP